MNRLVLFICLSLLATCAQALPVVLGTFEGDIYAYEDSTIVYADNVRLVWVVTASQKFNYTDDPEYVGALGRFAIDCSGHPSVFVEGVTLDKNNKVIQSGKVPEERWQFIAISEHTPQFALYRALCVEQPII